MNFYDKLFKEAKRYFQDGNTKMAEPLLQQLILENYKNPEVYQMLASLLYDQGKFSKAIQTLKKALEIDPQYTDASVGLSIILNDLGRYDEAKQVFHEAQLLLDKKKNQNEFLDEKLASKYEELGDLFFQFKRFDECLDYLKKARDLSHRKEDISLRIAEVYYQNGEVEKALRELKALALSYPQSPGPRLKLGIIYFNRNQLAEAKEQWENILVRDPDHPEAKKYIQLAESQLKLNISLENLL